MGEAGGDAAGLDARPGTRSASGTRPTPKWFVGGQLNVAANCLDRHLTDGRRNKAALIFEGEPGDTRVLTYHDLHREVCKLANVLAGQGISKGDRVTIYLPAVPEAVISMLACARIGAVHTVVFGGFSSDSLAERISDSQSKLLITADGGWRRGNPVRLKDLADKALEGETTIETVIVVNRTEDAKHVSMKQGRDFWWHRLMEEVSIKHEAQPMDAEDPLYILYTSGSTGKPKGILHTSGGYLTGVAATTKYIFDVKDDDVYWCTADVGWVTGHSYVVYGPLANGATVFLYEGAPDWPQRDRFWSADREVRHHDSLYGPDRHPGLYEMGDGLAREARPVFPAPARLGRRADQPGSVALVPTRTSAAAEVPHCGYLVADRDRRRL